MERAAWLEQGCRVEELGHTAEIGLRVTADSAESLFICLAQAMFALTGAQPDRAAAPLTRTVRLSAFDSLSLLVDWLSYLLYLHETTNHLFVEFTFEALSAANLRAVAVGYPLAQRPVLDIKAVTYHDLQLGRVADGWQAQVYFDI
jgi:SHS2 domain-containing protein